MAVTQRVVQLHKKDDPEEQWLPVSTGTCVALTDYTRDASVTGAIAQTDTLNTALMKIENTAISNKAEVDVKIAQLGVVYRAMGSVAELNYSMLNSACLGYVYNLSETITQIRKDGNLVPLADYFIEGSVTSVPAGANVVIANFGTESNPNIKFDVLAMSITSGGSGTVSPNTSGANKVAYYSANDSTVYSASNLTFDNTNKSMTIGDSNGGKLTVGTRPSGNTSAMCVNGDSYIQGAITSTGNITGFYSASDRNLKEDVQSFNAMDIVNALNPVSFRWNDDAKKINKDITNGMNYGVIAQDSEGVIDDFVFDLFGDGKYKGVRYEKLIPILLQAIKEQNTEIISLKNEIKVLKNEH